MGAYRSTPVRDKAIQQGHDDKLAFTAASMHGWRYNQEDRFKCQLNLQEGVSMFGVFDGHGGPEVAEYIALHLHQFLATFDLNLENIENTLRDAFLQFDTRFRNDPNCVEDYFNQLRAIKKLCTPDPQLQNSPLQQIFCSKRHRVKTQPGQSSSHAADVAPQPGGSKRSIEDTDLREGLPKIIITDVNAVSKLFGSLTKKRARFGKHGRSDAFDEGDEGQPKRSKLDTEGVADSEQGAEGTGANATEGKGDGGAGVSASVTSTKVQMSLLHPSGEIEQAEKTEPNEEEGEAEDDPEDSDFDCGKIEEEDDELAEDFDFNDSKVVIGGHPMEEPGVDSGSTACVVFVYNKGDQNRLVVANIGDCRAVLCRNGEHFDLSADHKPDNAGEKARIEAAGGTVNDDGRIDTGLNLSRAFGDYFYKRNTGKPADEQMVIAVPDVKIYDIEEGDSFVLVASDGIWNSMDSAAVIEYVKNRRDEGMEYREIVSELMDNILAADTSGDGTGCDNMTMVVIDLMYQQNLTAESSDKSDK